MTDKPQGNVIDIKERLNVKRYLKGGTNQFLQCRCSSENGFAPVVDISGAKPFIIALVCTSCGDDFEVINGGIQ